MGTWGFKPFENDAALDVKGDFEDSGDIGVLENAVNEISKLEKGDYIDAVCAAEAIAAAAIIMGTETFSDVLKIKAQDVVRRVLESSELKDLWEESGELDSWQREMHQLL